MIRHVVWDWNGTLLDDVDHALSALNAVLGERGLATIDRVTYRERFGFPVKDFYVELGFDVEREDFAALSETFIGHYRVAAKTASIHEGAARVMAQLRARNITQSVLSAAELKMLDQMLRERDLLPFLRHVRGLDHMQASSKVQLGVQLGVDLLRELDTAPDEIVFVGDTLHDHETASAMGAHCLLFAQGHQAKERLSSCGAQVIESLHEVIAFVHARN